jgi:UDP-N-acetylmuramoyl-L-alanyl-D-glutamate--2,6-diaminopimelate ligase
MTVDQVLAGITTRTGIPERIRGEEVRGLDYDSRRIQPGFLFFAFPGAKTDGREFAGQAVQRGALTVLSETGCPEGFQAAWIEVEHGRRALACAAKNFYRAPDERLGITGITGTNGKTTTAFLTESILRAAGKVTAMIGTIEYHLAGGVRPAPNTTPESLDLFRMFTELEHRNGTHVTMEVSSHALALGRVYGIQFHTAVFTNLTRDHLDFHHTMEEYFQAKHALFEGPGAAPPPFAAINYDDEQGRAIRTAPASKVLWYGMGESVPPGDALRACGVSSDFRGVRFDVQSPRGRFRVESSLLGRINIYNILAACAAGLTYGFDPATIAAGIRDCASVPGRFERIEEGQPFLVVVDYAHTDDALRNVIAVARSLSPRRVITLFGCGGDRDRVKRPLMGMAAGEGSDFVVLTSDNPRSEDPLDIINDALVGLRRFDTPHAVEVEREKGIRRAIDEAEPGDIVIIAGKGHEPYQVLRDRTIPFDDREAARRILHDFGYGRAKE